MEWTLEHNYPLSAFFADACALTFLLGVAAWFVKQYHKCTKKPAKLFHKIERQAAQIAAQQAIDTEQDAQDAEQQHDIDQLVKKVAAMQEDIRMLNMGTK